MTDNKQQAFFELVRAGLWEKDAQLLPFKDIDYNAVLDLAQEQSVVGLVAAGIEHVVDTKIPKENVFAFAGTAVQFEQVNKAMNNFVWELIDKLRKADIYTILVKGQGIAQCYERPLWRACGDVDLFLSDGNYQKAFKYLLPLSSSHDEELEKEKHVALTINDWIVELHGSLPSRISARADKVLEEIQRCVFYGGNVSSWKGGKTDVFLLHPDENVVYVFTHILKHFFRGGIGLRQICDWCRLLWTSRDVIDKKLLLQRLEDMRFMSEWKAFAALAVDVLGMPVDAMPFYSPSPKWKRKANRVLRYILSVGNFGNNRDGSFRTQQPFLKRKWIAFKYKVQDFTCHFGVFPLDSLKVFFTVVKSGIVYTLRHEG